ncbi:MAG TPA: hypothetical protein VEO54_11515 [Thermoanaerobaculia bacterium]|nr:hypothetical protein [Thermoanaerobaculia bacterium]
MTRTLLLTLFLLTAAARADDIVSVSALEPAPGTELLLKAFLIELRSGAPAASRRAPAATPSTT